MPQQSTPWFDPYSPITTFGSGAESVMQGLYAQALMKKQQDELARQFNLTHGLAQQKQDWDQTNTPAFQFGQMADVTRDKFGQEVPVQTVQENYFRQFKPKQVETLDEQARKMVESGGAVDMADAYDKLQKVGRYNIYNTPSRAPIPSADTVKYQDAARRYAAGEFGKPGTPEAQAGFIKFIQSVSTKPTLNTTPPKALPEHKAIVGTAASNFSTGLKAIDTELKTIASKPELFDDEGNPLPMEGAQPTGGFLGIGKTVKQWPPFYAQRFKLLQSQRAKMAAAMKFIQYLQDMVQAGYELPPNVVNWVNKVNNMPTSVLDDDSVLGVLPQLQQELQAGQGATGGTEDNLLF